ELLYLYGFVIDNNPDDYLMVHYPIEAFQSVPSADTKGRLLEIQKAEMRCLLPRTLLDQGFFPATPRQCEESSVLQGDRMCNYSWSGQREIPSYSSKLVFPEDFLTALRTIAMKEEELNKVSSLLEELIGPGEERRPSNAEVRAAIWEACGDSGALQLLVDLLQMKMMELEEGSGTEACDTALLEKALIIDIPEGSIRDTEVEGVNKMSRHRWSSIIYRRGQKQLARLFLMEAEHALQLCLSEEG
ncbi:Set domain-containing protein, partial [Thalictrum thalictroides]